MPDARIIDPTHPFMAATDRTPPCSLEAEQAVLGAILVDGAVYERVCDTLQPEHFFDPAHVRIFEAMTACANYGQAITPPGLARTLDGDPTLRELGNTDYLAQLAASVITLAYFTGAIAEAMKRGHGDGPGHTSTADKPDQFYREREFNGHTRLAWRVTIEGYRDNGPSAWPRSAYGPYPGEPGCLAPPDLLETILKPKGQAA